jgi:hypothetical protein
MAALDLKPGSCPNPVNVYGHGLLPFAVTGTELFDVTQIDIDSIRLRRTDGVGSEVGGFVRFAIEDVTTRFYGESMTCSTEGPDGYPDISAKARHDAVVEALYLADEPNRTRIELEIVGQLLDGTPFTASDSLLVIRPR